MNNETLSQTCDVKDLEAVLELEIALIRAVRASKALEARYFGSMVGTLSASTTTAIKQAYECSKNLTNACAELPDK